MHFCQTTRPITKFGTLTIILINYFFYRNPGCYKKFLLRQNPDKQSVVLLQIQTQFVFHRLKPWCFP